MNIKTDRMIIRDFTMNDINDMQDILGDAEKKPNERQRWKLGGCILLWTPFRR